MGEIIKTRGMIVGEAILGEQDKRLTLLCVDRGRISAVAKGAKKQGAKLASQVQLFYFCDLMLEKSRSFWMIKEATVQESFYELRQDMERLAWASWMAETAQQLAVEGEECNDLLRLLVRGFKLLSSPSLSVQMTAVTFVLRSLAMQGIAPDTSCCMACAQPLQDRALVSVSAGGLFCPSCARQAAEGIWLDAGGIYTLHHIMKAQEASVYKFRASEAIEKDLFDYAVQLQQSYMQREMNSLKFIRNIHEML